MRSPAVGNLLGFDNARRWLLDPDPSLVWVVDVTKGRFRQSANARVRTSVSEKWHHVGTDADRQPTLYQPLTNRSTADAALDSATHSYI
jgi:hypothetical protein